MITNQFQAVDLVFSRLNAILDIQHQMRVDNEMLGIKSVINNNEVRSVDSN